MFEGELDANLITFTDDLIGFTATVHTVFPKFKSI